MQDLEELKFRVAVYAESGLTEMARDLIARCEIAEKDCESWGILCKQAGIERDAAMSELKELREQKPVAWRKEHKVDIGVKYSYTSTLSHVEDWAALGVTLTPLYANPFEQSPAPKAQDQK